MKKTPIDHRISLALLTAVLLAMVSGCQAAPEPTVPEETAEVEDQVTPDPSGDQEIPRRFPGQPIRIKPKTEGGVTTLQWQEQSLGGSWADLPTNSEREIRGDMIFRWYEVKAKNTSGGAVTDKIEQVKFTLKFDFGSGLQAIPVVVDVKNGFMDWEIHRDLRPICCGTDAGCRGVPDWLSSELKDAKIEVWTEGATDWLSVSEFGFTSALEMDDCS